MQQAQNIGTYHFSNTTIFHFRKEGKCTLVDYIFEGKEGTFPIDQHTFHILPESDFSLPLEENIKKLLVNCAQPEVLRWSHPFQSLVDHICRLHSSAKDQTKKNQFDEAIELILLAKKQAALVDDPLGEAHFLEKLDRNWLQDLLNGKISDQSRQDLEQLLLQKDAVRRTFEIFLKILSDNSSQEKKPTCFVCFAFEEGVTDWLEQIFVPDLDQAGIDPIVCFRQLDSGKDLNIFQARIRYTDLVLLICTPLLKDKCEKRKDASVGSVQEVRLAQERYNDKNLKDSIFPIYLKGDHRTVCPSPFFEPILGTNFTIFDRMTTTQLFNYYGSAFELFGAMRGVKRQKSREIKRAFVKETKDILRYDKIDLEGVFQWRKEKEAWRELLLAKIQESVTQALLYKENFSFNVPHPNFVGRKSLLERLAQAFELKDWKYTNPTQVRILCGPGGIGKTELALKFGNDFLSSFSLIWFFRAESTSLYEEDYRKLGLALHLNLGNCPFEKVQKEVHKKLELLREASRPWLLIIDNVEANFEIPMRGGYVIATTQRRNIWADPNAFIEVPPFTSQEAVRLFQQFQCNVTEQDIQPLINRVDGLPVLLEQAALFIRRSYCLLDEYLRDIQNIDLLWEQNVSKRYPKVLGKVFEKNLIDLQKSHTDAYKFIKFCAYLNPDSISIDLLSFWCQKNSQQSLSKRKIIGSLSDFNLIRFNLSKQTFSMHRLLKEVLQNLNKNQQEETYFSTASLLADWSKNFDRRNQETWKIGKECFNHLEKFRSHKLWLGVNDEVKGAIFFAIGSYQYAIQGKCKQALEFLEESLQLAKKCFGEISSEFAKGCSELGLCYVELKEKEKAFPLLSKSLEVRKELFGEVHPETAKSYNHLSLYMEIKTKEHLDLRLKYLEIILKIHPDVPHLNIALGYHNIAESLLHMERYSEAHENIFKAIKIFEKFYNNKPYYEGVGAYYLLGVLLIYLKRELEAQEAFQKAEQMCKLIYGKNHHHIIDYHLKLANSFNIFKKYDAALQEYEKAIAISLKLYEFNSSEVAHIYYLEGEVFESVRQYEKALICKQKRLEICQYLEKDDELGKAYFDVGYNFYVLGDLLNALLHFENAINTLNRVSGNQEILFSSHHNIGLVLSEQNNHFKALPYFLTALKGVIQIKSPQVPKFFKNTLKSLMNQTDKDYALAVKIELLNLFFTNFGHDNEYVTQLNDLKFS